MINSKFNKIFRINNTSPTTLEGPLQNQEGATLIIVVLFLALLAILAPVAQQNTAREIERVRDFREERQAFFLAEAGVHHATSIIRAQNLDSMFAGPDGDPDQTADNGTIDITGSSSYTHDGNTFTKVGLATGSNSVGDYIIRVYDNDDGDGDLTQDSDQLGYVHSIGQSPNGITKELLVMVQSTAANPPNFPAAVTLVGPAAFIDNQGSGFSVSGFSTQLDGTDDPDCPDTNGIAIEASAANTGLNFGGNSEDNITGKDGGEPDLVNDQTEFTLQDAQDMWNELTPTAVSLANGKTTGGTLGTIDNPQVTYATGDVELKGNVSGAGILIIDGDLNISGNLDFDGIILVGVCVTCDGSLVGTGSSDIDGAMVVGNPVNTDDSGDPTATFTGSARINYSCEGVNVAGEAMGLSGSFQTISWREVD